MGTISCQFIVNKALVILDDIDSGGWALADLQNHLCEMQRYIAVSLKPNAYIKNTVFSLVPGTKQTVPSDGIQLVKAPRNLGVSGVTPGAAITMIGMDRLDSARPNWHAETATEVVKHVALDIVTPKHFYVYPSSTGTNKIDIFYRAIPGEILIDEAILLDDSYDSELVDLIVYRALSTDSEYGQQDSRAKMHYDQAVTSLTAKINAENAVAAAAASGSR